MIQSVGDAKPYGPLVIKRQQDADWLISDCIADKNVACLQPNPRHSIGVGSAVRYGPGENGAAQSEVGERGDQVDRSRSCRRQPENRSAERVEFGIRWEIVTPSRRERRFPPSSDRILCDSRRFAEGIPMRVPRFRDHQNDRTRRHRANRWTSRLPPNNAPKIRTASVAWDVSMQICGCIVWLQASRDALGASANGLSGWKTFP